MKEVIDALYGIILDRKTGNYENSYTRYLFDQGIDKILKKVGEESSEVIIAAKNGENSDTENELCDLVYHLLVLMAQQGITPDDVETVLEKRRLKSGNLKKKHESDKYS